MRSPLSETETNLVRSEYCAAIERLVPALTVLAGRVIDRISPPNWSLEWYLPRWLGDAFGLPLPISQRLVLCNVFGLAFIRLQDDLADGEVAEGDWSATTGLASLLFQQAILRYVELFDRQSAFWRYFEGWMSRWVKATVSGDVQPKNPTLYGEQDLLPLAERGAPLKICGAAVCLLVGREDAIPALTRLLDDALVSLVLLDHAVDWQGDLLAARYNTFIAYFSDLPQTPDCLEANRSKVQAALYFGDAGQPYFDLIRKHLRAAIESSRALDIEELGHYLAELESQVDAYYRSLREGAQAALRAATDLLFGSPATPNSTPVPVKGG